MRIITWNVNSLRARMPRVLELLAQHKPDVVCLQETKTSPENFPASELAAAGYTAVHHSGGQWAGVALLVHAGLNVTDPVLVLAGDSVPQEARWCEAVVSGVRVISVYVPHGRSLDSPEFPRKLQFFDAAAARVRELHGSDLVVAGDMNVAPADIDVYDPAAFVGATHVTPQERQHLSELLDSGLLDAYRRLHPTDVQYTWWDYRGGDFHRGLGMRIDLALVSDGLADRLRACGIDRDYRKGPKPSDHAPLIVDLSGAAH